MHVPGQSGRHHDGHLPAAHHRLGRQLLTIDVAAVVAPGVVAPSITNAVSVRATTPDPDNTDNQTSTSTPIQTSADLSITKTGPATVLWPGNKIAWTVRASNAGPSDAQAVVVTDTLPAGITGASGTSSRGPCSDCPGTC